MTQELPTNDTYSAMNQAAETAHRYLGEAVSSIDKMLGDGYAKKHPELIGAYMNAAAADYMAWMNGVCTAHIKESIDVILSPAIDDIANAINSVADGIDRITETEAV